MMSRVCQHIWHNLFIFLISSMLTNSVFYVWSCRFSLTFSEIVTRSEQSCDKHWLRSCLYNSEKMTSIVGRSQAEMHELKLMIFMLWNARQHVFFSLKIFQKCVDVTGLWIVTSSPWSLMFIWMFMLIFDMIVRFECKFLCANFLFFLFMKIVEMDLV